MRAADNPFRSSAIESLKYEGASPRLLYEAWLRHGMRGAIVGPHGSGKTTLLHELLSIAHDNALRPHLITVRLESDRVEMEPAGLPVDDCILFIDGIDLLPELRKLARRAQRVLATSHSDTSLPLLHCCTTSIPGLRTLLDKLQPCGFDDERLELLFNNHAGNIREIFRTLYDDCRMNKEFQRRTSLLNSYGGS